MLVFMNWFRKWAADFDALKSPISVIRGRCNNVFSSTSNKAPPTLLKFTKWLGFQFHPERFAIPIKSSHFISVLYIAIIRSDVFNHESKGMKCCNNFGEAEK